MLGHGLIGRIEVFFLTFFGYACVHSLRTAYSYSKHHIAEAVGADKSLIGLVDTALLLSLGLGFMFNAMIPSSKKVRNLSVALLICSLTYASIPYAIDHYLNNIYVLLVFMSINGFLQSFTWTNLLVIVYSKWDKDRNSAAMGFWTTNSNIGNIIGFFLCEEVHSLELPWEDEMYLAALFTFVMGVLIFWRIPEVQVSPPAQASNKKHVSLGTVLREPSFWMVCGGLSFSKSIIYGIMLWLPLYFQNIGLEEYSTYIPITYDFCCIVGSVLLGYLFGRIHLKSLLLAPLMVVLVICFYILKFFQISILGYFILISIVGMSLGGSFNTIVNLSTVHLTRHLPAEQRLSSLSFYSTTTMAIANVVTALTQLLIGFVVGKDEQRIFMIFMMYSGLALGVFCYQLWVQLAEQKADKKPKQISQAKQTKQRVE